MSSEQKDFTVIVKVAYHDAFDVQAPDYREAARIIKERFDKGTLDFQINEGDAQWEFLVQDKELFGEGTDWMPLN